MTRRKLALSLPRRFQRIVQLEETEYDELYRLAHLNKEEIESLAEKWWQERGIAWIKIDAAIGHTTLYDHSIKCNNYIGMKNDTFCLDEKLREGFEKYINEQLLSAMRNEYGKGISMAQDYENALKGVNSLKFQIGLIAFSGWGAFIGCLMYLIFR